MRRTFWSLALVGCSGAPEQYVESAESSSGTSESSSTSSSESDSGPDSHAESDSTVAATSTANDSTSSDGGTTTDGTTTDGTTTDADGTTTDADGTTTTDDGTTTSDTSSSSSESSSSTDTGEPLPGLGDISGDCGQIDSTEIDSASPFEFHNAIDFGITGYDYDLLTAGGQQIFDAGNLGGSSLHSEIIAFEVLARCEDAELLETEGTIEYIDEMGTKTDLLVSIDGHTVGVSVVRAITFPFDDPYTVDIATEILTGKLSDILVSSANVAPEHAWDKQILHVIAYADMHADSIATAYAALDADVQADTILVVTVTDGDDAFIY